jgi:hypothetical protein
MAVMFQVSSMAGLVLSNPQLQDGSGPDRSTTSLTHASSTQSGFLPEGAIDGDRYSPSPGRAWAGKPQEASWAWEVRFRQPTFVGAILQVVGDHADALRNAPSSYVWQITSNGVDWIDLEETRVTQERRLFRILRLKAARETLGLRIRILGSQGTFPVIREVQWFANPRENIPFEPWSVIVTTTGDAKIPGEGMQFLPLARSCPGFEKHQAQNIWLGDFHEEFLRAEPRPLCAFLSGNFIDWCQQDRKHWAGAAEVLENGNLPIWASCGGAQGLAILAEHGVTTSWDCPHCRDPKNPKTPIYGHIGHTSAKPCGDYSGCRFEKGPFNILQSAQDPAFTGLPREFRAMESHCGQIEWAPKGWTLLATAGQGTLTKIQCIRKNDRPIYAAQFHIEMAGTPATSRKIMANFLLLATKWGGINPQARTLTPPESLSASQP